jgi:hypothetical protein
MDWNTAKLYERIDGAFPLSPLMRITYIAHRTSHYLQVTLRTCTGISTKRRGTWPLNVLSIPFHLGAHLFVRCCVEIADLTRLIGRAGEPDAIANMCYLETSERTPFQDLFWVIWRSRGYTLPAQTHRHPRSTPPSPGTRTRGDD